MDEVVNESPVTEEQTTEAVVTPQPGEKTDSALLLKSLQEEREKRRLADAEVERLKKLQDPQDIVSDEGRVLQKQIAEISSELESRKTMEAIGALQARFPALKDKSSEFESYLQANPGVGLEIAAKAFLVDHDLIEAPRRQGLEKSTGGTRAPAKAGMSADEIDDLRINNYRKYSDMVRKGQVKFD